MSRLNGVADREKFTVRVELHDHTIMWSYLTKFQAFLGDFTAKIDNYSKVQKQVRNVGY